MRRNVMCWFGGMCLGVAVTGGAAQAMPLAGVDVGAAIPTDNFQHSAHPGGAVAPYVGYQLFTLGNTAAFSLLAQPQFASFAGSSGSVGNAANVFSLTAGPRISLFDEHLEAYFSAQGGYYWGFSSHLNNDGGFNFGGGLNYEFLRGTTFGAYIRRDQSSMNVPGSYDDVHFLVTGFELQHRYLPPPAVAEAAPPPPPPPAPTPAVKKKIILRGVTFDFDKASIRAEARPILDEATSTLQEHSAITIVAEGYTDDIGSEAYNQKLSVRRAKAVRDYLVGHGIAASRVTVEGFGESHPVASNATAEGRAQNRRVELRVTNESE
jgi:outer membrane protein OmpA-like peptidoglycan-associated protein